MTTFSLLNRSICRGTIGLTPFLANSLRQFRFLYTSESVLTRDLFLQSTNPRPSSYYSRSTTDFESDLDGIQYNQNIIENLHDPEFQDLLRARTSHLQSFLGEEFSLLFEELACTVCGLANMSILPARNEILDDSLAQDSLKTLIPPLTLGSPFSRVLMQQDTLREVGKRFFVMQAQASTTFADVGHLTTHHRELELSLMVLDNTDGLVCDFMKRNSLYDVVIPYRGAQSAGSVPAEQAKEFRTIIRDQTCVGSFYTLLGLLVSKFGSAVVRDGFWNSRVLDPNLGIIKIATDHYNGNI